MFGNLPTSTIPSVDLTISETALWLIWILMAFTSMIFAIIFFYHWKKYDWGDGKVKKGSAIFLLGIFIILLISAVSVFFIF